MADSSETKDNNFDSFVVGTEPARSLSPFPRDYPLADDPARNSKRSLAARVMDLSGCGELLRRMKSWRGLLILNYHRIGYPAWSDLDRNLWSATPENFTGQLASLKQHFDVISLKDIDTALTDRRGRFVMITFDDGYRDNFTRAYKALRYYNLPATFFLTTGFLDQQLVPWWDEIAWMVRNSSVEQLPASPWLPRPVATDRGHWNEAIGYLLKVYKTLDGKDTAPYLAHLSESLRVGRCPPEVGRELWMTWDMVRDMQAHGMSFGGHTVTHPILARLTPEEQDFEIGESRRRLVTELGEPIDAFSYPVGGPTSYNEATQLAVERHGYRWAFTYLGGYLKPGQFDRYALRRTAIETDVDVPLFRAITTLPQFFA